MKSGKGLSHLFKKGLGPGVVMGGFLWWLCRMTALTLIASVTHTEAACLHESLTIACS